MDQTRTPLVDALASFSRTNRGYFNIPGHHGARGVDESLLSLFGTGVFEADRTETDGVFLLPSYVKTDGLTEMAESALIFSPPSHLCVTYTGRHTISYSAYAPRKQISAIPLPDPAVSG